MIADLPPWERPDDLTIDLFAGPGGWDEGAGMVGLPGRIIGVERDEAACATAEAAGHPRHRGDLSMLAVDHFGPFSGLIASPPCQAWSTAGKGLGKLDQPRILAHLDRIRDAGRWLHYSREGWHDDRSPLVLEPVRWALLGHPEWIACEQVPAVLPFWQAFAEVLNDHGYDVATGKLSAERYGVPQTRQRAILVATRVGSFAGLPAPTHQGYTKRKPIDAESPLPRWVSMAEALGWDDNGTTQHVPRSVTFGVRPGRDLQEPSFTITGSGRNGGGAHHAPQWMMRTNRQANAAERYADEPAPTIKGGHDTADRVWVGQARNSGPGAQRDPRSTDEPSYTIRAAGSGSHPSGVEWVGAKFGNQDNSAVRSVDEPAATIRYSQRGNALDWVHGRPAGMSQAGDTSTAIEPRDLESPAGTITGKGTAAWTPRPASGAVRVSVDEAARLQTFPYGYPWQGKKTKQYEQVGNAIPPLLAAAILGNLHNLPAWRDVCMSMRPEAVPERTAA